MKNSADRAPGSSPNSDPLGAWGARAEAALTRLLPATDGPANRLEEAMRYACLGGGKRLRACLVYATGHMLGTPEPMLDHPAAAIEMIHAYSLVHDDLPAMDDDDLRRGKPSCHKVYGEGQAILVGDALQSHAFQTLAAADSGIAAPACAEMVRALASASGARGMAGGQALDLQAVGSALDINELSTLHRLKTGALIACAVRLGALCGGRADANTMTQLGIFADHIGFAFQIVDDILDEIMDSETLGKTGGRDRARDKPTYTTMLGLNEAREMSAQLHKTALESLATIRHNTENLKGIADFVVNRRF